MEGRLEKIIISSLCFNEPYLRKVVPFLRPEYFSNTAERIVFQKIVEYTVKYNSPPSKEALVIAVQEDRSVSESHDKGIETLIQDIVPISIDLSWLLDETEKFCKDRALYNAIMESIQIIDGKNKTYGKESLPHLLSDALAVGFDTSVGHDYIENANSRYEFYHRQEEKLEFDLQMFNKITDGGLSNKTLNIALAGTGVGKSLFMCHMSAAHIARGKNVLYITLEMSEERIAERIDANMMNIPIQDLKTMTKTMYDDRINKINDKIQGKLIIKEYPTASAHCGHFKSLLSELKLKKNFIPDIIFIDYLNICSSSRFKPGSSANSYTVIKSIAEELRGLAVEFDVPIVSATQTTRGGFNNSDVELTDTSESFGLPATADLMFALISNEELEKMGQIMVKQLKNRYSDLTRNKRFMIGVDRARMKLYDLEDSQKGLTDAGADEPVFDNTKFGKRAAMAGGNYDEIKF